MADRAPAAKPTDGQPAPAANPAAPAATKLDDARPAANPAAPATAAVKPDSAKPSVLTKPGDGAPAASKPAGDPPTTKPPAGTELAQRVTKPGEPPPPAPPPPAVQPRSGVTEPPRPGSAEPPKPAPTPSAATPPVAPSVPIGPVRITFETDSTSLTADARAMLDTVVMALKANATVRALLKAYSSTGTSVSETRRLSLKRGMTVRLYLIDKGIPPARIDLQALGKSPDSGPGDRVDVMSGKP
jgi:outer membrane protein OmpA-like peptidoglycan-associated protein